MKVSRDAEITIKDDIRGIYYENGKLYMTIPCIHSIVTYDFETKKVQTLRGKYPPNNVFEKILKYGDKIYLFPANGSDIYYYDMKKKKYKNLFLLDFVKDDVDFSNRKFFEVVVIGRFIYAVCRNPNAVICINALDDAIQVYYLTEELLEGNPAIIEHFPICIYDKKLIYAYSSDLEIDFSLTNKEFNFVYLTQEKDDCKAEHTYIVYGMLINEFGDKWLYNLYGDLFRVVNNKKIRVEIPAELVGIYSDGFNAEQYKINQVLLIKDKLYFIPQSDHKILIYDIQANVFTWCENPYADWKEGRRKLAYTLCAKIDSISYLLYHYNNSAIYVWNIEEGFTDKFELKLSVEEVIRNEAFNEYILHYFLRQDDLDAYLVYISGMAKKRISGKEKCCGKKIYQKIEE